ncbi:MAG: hypothetical protein PHO18_04470, partial [Synergistaceae bacterium]|nr:hypothetical protein [Synergistaceae bacterium]
DLYQSMIYRAPRPGPIKDSSGNILGEHLGINRYTLGQRKGLGIASKHPLFVVSIDPKANTVEVASKEEAFRSEVTAGSVNILASEFLHKDPLLLGKIRSQGAPEPCRLTSVSNEIIKVQFLDPVFAPAPGQRLVLYNTEGFVAAGGTIISSR